MSHPSKHKSYSSTPKGRDISRSETLHYGWLGTRECGNLEAERGGELRWHVGTTMYLGKGDESVPNLTAKTSCGNMLLNRV